MEIIIAGTQSPLQTLINQACIGKDYYIPIFFAGKMNYSRILLALPFNYRH